MLSWYTSKHFTIHPSYRSFLYFPYLAYCLIDSGNLSWILLFSKCSLFNPITQMFCLIHSFSKMSMMTPYFHPVFCFSLRIFVGTLEGHLATGLNCHTSPFCHLSKTEPYQQSLTYIMVLVVIMYE